MSRQRSRSLRVIALFFSLALLAVACSSSDDDSSSTTTAVPDDDGADDEDHNDDDDVHDEDDATTSTTSTTVAPDLQVLDATELVTPVNEVEPGGAPADVPSDGTIKASWYKFVGVEGNYAIVFSGMDFTAADPLCPGASVQTDSGFQNITNGPTEPGACDGFSTDLPELSPRVCGEILVYFTVIPVAAEGTLKATIERGPADAITGITSSIPTNGGVVPEIQGLGVDGYTFEGTDYVCDNVAGVTATTTTTSTTLAD